MKPHIHSESSKSNYPAKPLCLLKHLPFKLSIIRALLLHAALVSRVAIATEHCLRVPPARYSFTSARLPEEEEEEGAGVRRALIPAAKGHTSFGCPAPVAKASSALVEDFAEPHTGSEGFFVTHFVAHPPVFAPRAEKVSDPSSRLAWGSGLATLLSPDKHGAF